MSAAAKAPAWTKCWRTGADGVERMEFTVTLPIRTVSETNQRENHFARHRRRKRQKKDAELLVGIMARVESISVPCTVTLTRIAPRALDAHDNLPSSLKATVDGIAAALGVDDRDPRVRWLYAQRRGAAKAYGVEICVARG